MRVDGRVLFSGALREHAALPSSANQATINHTIAARHQFRRRRRRRRRAGAALEGRRRIPM